jgi:hypothetical protein
MQDNPYGQVRVGAAPIPAPDALQTVVVANREDWQNAPIVIRGWAYTIAFLGMLAGAVMSVMGLFNDDSMAEKAGGLIFCILFFAGMLWQRTGLRRGTGAAWTVQIVLSALGLLAFPLGTLVHGYILSKWFKPEVKAWFGQQ